MSPFTHNLEAFPKRDVIEFLSIEQELEHRSALSRHDAGEGLPFAAIGRAKLDSNQQRHLLRDVILTPLDGRLRTSVVIRRRFTWLWFV